MQSVSVDTSAHVASTAKKRSAPLDSQTADRLLDLLSSDDAFRRLFKRDPRRALEQVGFVESSLLASPGWCFFGITKLASKAQISAARVEIRTMLTSGLGQSPPLLDAANPGEARRKLK